MTAACKTANAKAGAVKLRTAAPQLSNRAKEERTNKILQAWRENVSLRACSVAARGLWIEMISIMRECEPYGYLALNGAPMKVSQLAHLVGEPISLVDQLLTELYRAGAFDCKNKCIYSREMAAPILEQWRGISGEGRK